MKQVLGGFMAFWVGSCCGGVATGDDLNQETVRIVPGQRVVSTPQVVSNTITMGGGAVPAVRVNVDEKANPRYIGGTPMVDVDVHMGNVTVDSDVPSGRSGGQNYPQRATYAPQQVYSAQPGYNRQPTNYYSGQSAYYRGNAVNTQDAGAARYSNGVYVGNGGTKTVYRQTVVREPGERVSEGTVSRAYLYNKHGNGYVGMGLDVNLLNWTNKYKAFPDEAIYNEAFDHDDYRFRPLIGGHFVAGYRFSPGWRADVEGGFTSEFEDSDNGITFKLSAPYVTANVYHDFINGLYLGAGVGAAFPTISMEWENFITDGSSKTGVSLTGAAMLGYTYYLSDSLILDLRYRFSGFNGTTLKRDTNYQTDTEHSPLESVETKVGFVMDNSISIGLKYEF